jgi:hypothetical protein
MAKKATAHHRQRNEYRCYVEINQNGKFCVRMRVRFTRHGWVLPVFFLASTFPRAIRKLEQTLQFLQRNEDRLWFWGVDRSNDPNISDEMLREAGLRLDRRVEFPRHSEKLRVVPEQPVPAPLLVPVRRALAGSLSSSQTAAAGD